MFILSYARTALIRWHGFVPLTPFVSLFHTHTYRDYFNSNQNLGGFFQGGNTDRWTLEYDVTLISCVRRGLAFFPISKRLLISPSLADRGTVSILALSRIQREEMSSDAFPRENGQPLERCWRGCDSWESDSRNLSDVSSRKQSEKEKGRKKDEEGLFRLISISRQIWERKGARVDRCR